jgi:hypothetical protein
MQTRMSVSAFVIAGNMVLEWGRTVKRDDFFIAVPAARAIIPKTLSIAQPKEPS